MKNIEVILTENRPNGAEWRGVVKPFMLKSIEGNQYSGGFKRYDIDIYDEVEREPSKKEIKEANEFFDKVGGRYSKGSTVEGGGDKEFDSKIYVKYGIKVNPVRPSEFVVGKTYRVSLGDSPYDLRLVDIKNKFSDNERFYFQSENKSYPNTDNKINDVLSFALGNWGWLDKEQIISLGWSELKLGNKSTVQTQFAKGSTVKVLDTISFSIGEGVKRKIHHISDFRKAKKMIAENELNGKVILKTLENNYVLNKSDFLSCNSISECKEKAFDKYAKGSTIKGEKEYVVYGSVSSDENYQNFSKIVTANDEDEAIEKVVEWADIEYEYLWDVPQIELEFDLEARERMAKGSTVKGGEEKWFCLSYKVDGKPKKQYFTNKNEMNSAIKSMKSGQWRENYTDIKEINSYAKGSTIKNKYEHNDFPIMFVEIPFGYGKKQGMLVTKLYNLLKKHNIAIDNSKEWHTKGFGEEYENDENHNIVKFNVNDAPNPKKLTEILWNLPNGEYYVSATKDYKYANGGGIKVIRRISNNNKVVIDDNFPKNKLIFIGDDDLRLFLESKGYNFGYEGEPTNTNSDGDTYYNFEDLVKSYGFKMHFANNGKGRFDGWNYLVGTNDWIDYNLKSGNLDKSNIKYANGGGVGILEQRIALAKKKSKVAKDGKYFGGEVYLVLQHKTDPEEIFVISQFNYNIDKHNNKWNDYNIVFKTNEYANGGVLNGNYLDTISNDKKNEILKNIANNYGISVAEAKAEVIDADAEMLYEYIANDKSLKMSVYNDFEYGKFAKGTTVKGGGGEGEFWAVASGRKLMGAFPNKKPKQSQYRLVGTGHGWNIKPYAEVQKEGAKDREFEKWELVKEPTDYYLIVKHDYTSGRETNFYQKPKNKYVNGGNTSIRKQKMETTNETRNRELNELQKQMLVNETDKVLFLTVEEIEEIQVLLSQMEDKSLSKEERDELFIKALDIQLKKEINGKTYYTIGYTAKNKGRNYGWRQATEIFNKLRKIGVDAMICQYIPLFSPNVPQSVEDFSFSVLTSPMLSYNSYKELLGGDSESIGEQGDPKNNYYYEDGGNTSSGYSYSIGGL